MIALLSNYKRDYKTARDNGRDLPGYVNANRMHEEEVLVVLLKTELMNDTRRHRECRYARRTYHGVDLVAKEQIEYLCKYDSAYRVKHECNKSERKDKERSRLEEFSTDHRC